MILHGVGGVQRTVPVHGPGAGHERALTRLRRNREPTIGRCAN
jgi:hypothetical protein